MANEDPHVTQDEVMRRGLDPITRRLRDAPAGADSFLDGHGRDPLVDSPFAPDQLTPEERAAVQATPAVPRPAQGTDAVTDDSFKAAAVRAFTEHDRCTIMLLATDRALRALPPVEAAAIAAYLSIRFKM